MARRIFSSGKRERLIERSQLEFKEKERKRQLYNFFYRRSAFFRVTVVLRALIFLIAFYLLNFNELVISATREILKEKKIEEFYIWRKTESNDNKDMILTTLAGNIYWIGFLHSKPDVFAPGDTLNVIRNIFGKTSYITKPGSEHLVQISKYRRLDNFLIFLVFINFLSLLSADGFDRLYRITIAIVLTLDAAAVALYLLI